MLSMTSNGLEVVQGSDGDGRREGVEVREPLGAWVVTFWWPIDARSGGPRAISLEPAPDADPQEIARGISSTVLRQINIADAIKQFESVVGPTLALKEKLKESAIIFDSLLRNGISDEYLAALSAQYVKSADMGSRAPIQDLMMWTGKNQATLKGHLREARKRGLLTKVEGKAGGRMTEKAIRLMEGILNGASVDQPG